MTDADDQRTFLELMVGRIVLVDVMLEDVLRSVFRDLMGVGHPGGFLAPDAFAPLVEACKVAVKWHPSLTDELRQWTAEALDAAAMAHRERNRVAHDLHLRQPVSDETPDETWTRHRFQRHKWPGVVSIVTRADLTSAFDELRRAAIRVNALHWALMFEFDGWPPRTGFDRDDWAMVRGEFDLDEGTGLSSVPHAWR